MLSQNVHNPCSRSTAKAQWNELSDPRSCGHIVSALPRIYWELKFYS